MWMDIVGHDQVASRFARLVRANRLASTYLFVGPAGVGKRHFARQLATCLFCLETPETELAACGRCQSCHLMAAGNHPDLIEVGLLVEKDKRQLLVEQFIGKNETRNRAGMCHDLALRPTLATRRVAIVDYADTLNPESANCLLKTLEEPPPRAVIVLVGTSESRQLATIRSRSQVIRFGPLETSDVERLLVEKHLVSDPSAARTVAELSEGSLEQARQIVDTDLFEVYQQAVALLSKPVVDSVRLTRLVHQYADSAGKEAPPKREALLAVLGLVARHFRRQLRAEPAAPTALQTIRRIERCLAAEYHVDRNAHLQTVVQAWAIDVATG